jgi:Na+/melibiose symporter-like transporter
VGSQKIIFLCFSWNNVKDKETNWDSAKQRSNKNRKNKEKKRYLNFRKKKKVFFLKFLFWKLFCASSLKRSTYVFYQQHFWFVVYHSCFFFVFLMRLYFIEHLSLIFIQIQWLKIKEKKGFALFFSEANNQSLSKLPITYKTWKLIPWTRKISQKIKM